MIPVLFTASCEAERKVQWRTFCGNSNILERCMESSRPRPPNMQPERDYRLISLEQPKCPKEVRVKTSLSKATGEPFYLGEDNFDLLLESVLSKS